jgi:hypothetical protein
MGLDDGFFGHFDEELICKISALDMGFNLSSGIPIPQTQFFQSLNLWRGR